jgi:hypothetical protein
MTSPRTRSLLTLALLIALVASAACTAVSDDTRSQSSAFASPGTGQQFLLAFWSGDIEHAAPYSGSVPGYPEDLRTPSTLAAWRRKYMPASEPVVHGIYRNVRELGGGPRSNSFWRKMSCTKRFFRGGPGGCVVVNYLDDFGDPDTNDNENDGTVAMNITRDGFVHFATFEAQDATFGNPELVEGDQLAILDNEGSKVAPHVCVNCHGGTIEHDQDLRRRPDLGSVFREFEPSLLERLPSVSQAVAEQQWFELNQAIVAANAALRSESEGAIPGVDHTRKAIADHVRDLYAGLGEPSSHAAPPFSRPVEAPELLPPSWRAADADSQALWSTLVNPYCMSCHRHNGLDFSSFAKFQPLRRVADGTSFLQKYIIDDRRGDEALPYMPQAQAAFEQLQTDHRAWAAIRRWSNVPSPDTVVEISGEAPNPIRFSQNAVTHAAWGPMALRVVNKSAYDIDMCIPVGSSCYGEERIPAGRPGQDPPEVKITVRFHDQSGPGHSIKYWVFGGPTTPTFTIVRGF